MKTSPVHDVGEDQNNSAMFSIIRRERQNKSILMVALNVVQYYNARLKFTANVAAATAIVAS